MGPGPWVSRFGVGFSRQIGETALVNAVGVDNFRQPGTTVFGKAVGGDTWQHGTDGLGSGSAEPVVQPTRWNRLPRRPLSGTLTGGPPI